MSAISKIEPSSYCAKNAKVSYGETRQLEWRGKSIFIRIDRLATLINEKDVSTSHDTFDYSRLSNAAARLEKSKARIHREGDWALGSQTPLLIMRRSDGSEILLDGAKRFSLGRVQRRSDFRVIVVSEDDVVRHAAIRKPEYHWQPTGAVTEGNLENELLYFHPSDVHLPTSDRDAAEYVPILLSDPQRGRPGNGKPIEDIQLACVHTALWLIEINLSLKQVGVSTGLILTMNDIASFTGAAGFSLSSKEYTDLTAKAVRMISGLANKAKFCEFARQQLRNHTPEVLQVLDKSYRHLLRILNKAGGRLRLTDSSWRRVNATKEHKAPLSTLKTDGHLPDINPSSTELTSLDICDVIHVCMNSGADLTEAYPEYRFLWPLMKWASAAFSAKSFGAASADPILQGTWKARLEINANGGDAESKFWNLIDQRIKDGSP